VRSLLFLGLFFLTTLFSNEITTIVDNINNQNNTAAHLPKVLYLKFEKEPKRVIKGEIFSTTIKTLSTVKDFTDITYELSNQQGLKLLNDFPYRKEDSKYYYDTFYFLVTSNEATLPNFKASLHDYNENIYKKTTLLGKKLDVVTLNPKDNFSNIIANSLTLVEYKTSTYDEKHNIVVFILTATNSDITTFNLQNIFKQGIESVTESFFDSKLIYYTIIDKKIQNLSFSYFNLKKNRYILLNIPIIVTDDSVTTQSDLKPKNQSHQKIKMFIAGGIALIIFILMMIRQKYIYLVFIMFPLAYIGNMATPNKNICIKEGSEIYLLPVQNATVFEKTNSVYNLQKEGSIKNFTKVKLQNQKIGWVKNEDICSN